MIKKLFTVAMIACALGSHAQQVQNPGFETWTSGNPANWGTFTQMLAAAGVTGAGLETQTTTKHSGSFAILLQTKNIAAVGQNLPGVCNTGPIALVGGSVSIGRQAYSAQPSSYSFWGELTLATGDTSFTQVTLTKWNTSLNKRDTLAGGGMIFTSNMASYTNVTVPISWTTVAAPDSIQLLFATSLKSTAPVGTMFYVDDVNMTVASGIQSLNADGTFSEVYPNPATTSITFATSDENAKYAKVFDLTGRAVATIELTGKITKADISSYENGMYIYVITDANGHKISTSKFNVAK